MSQHSIALPLAADMIRSLAVIAVVSVAVGIAACGSASIATPTLAPTVASAAAPPGDTPLPTGTPYVETPSPTDAPYVESPAPVAPLTFPYGNPLAATPAQWLALVKADANVLDADFAFMASDVSNGDEPTLIADAQGALHDISMLKLDAVPPSPTEYAHADAALIAALGVLTDACNKLIAGNRWAAELSTGESQLAQALRSL